MDAWAASLDSRKVFLLLLAVGFACYGNVIRGPFLFDDEHFIIRNEHLRSIRHWGDIFTSSTNEGAGLSASNFYRPLQMIVFSILYQAFDLNPISYHLAGILLHITNAFLLFLFLGRLGFGPAGQLLSALIFLMHPVQTEAVSYISGLADPLGFCLTLSGLLLFVDGFQETERRRVYLRVLGSALLFILALLSKEMTVTFPVLAVLLVLYFQRQSRNSLSWKAALPVFATIIVVYLTLKFTLFDFTGHAGLTGEKNVYTEHLWVRLVTFVSHLWEYARLLIYPWHLNYEKPYVAYMSLWNPRGLFGLVVVIAAVMGLVRSWYGQRKAFLGLAWFFVALAPVSGIVPVNAMYLEHWLYFPMAGLMILLAGSYESILWPTTRKVLAGVVLALLVVFGARTVARNEQWADIEKFYLNELKESRDSARIYNNQAMKQADDGRHEEAVANYQKAVALRDAYPQTHHNLANSYLALNRPEEAAREFYKALALDPNFIYSHAALSKLYAAFKMPTHARRFEEFVSRLQRGGQVTSQEIQRAAQGH